MTESAEDLDALCDPRTWDPRPTPPPLPCPERLAAELVAAHRARLDAEAALSAAQVALQAALGVEQALRPRVLAALRHTGLQRLEVAGARVVAVADRFSQRGEDLVQVASASVRVILREPASGQLLLPATG